MYLIRPLQKGDFVYENLRDYEKKFADKFGLEQQEETFLRTTHPFTLIVNNEIIGSAGFHIYWPGVAEVWLCANKSFERNWFKAVICIKKKIEWMIEENGVKRFQAPISATLELNQKFVKWLGFSAEGYMRKFGPWGDDYIMYSKVID